MVKVIYKVVRHFYRRIFHHFANFFHYQRGQRVALSFLAALRVLFPLYRPQGSSISPASQKWRKMKVEEHIYYKNLSTINHLRLPFLWTLVDNRHLQEWVLIRCPLKSEMT